MFSSVANYLFGSSQPEEEPVKEMELETAPAKDDDWLIVNVQDKTTCVTVPSIGRVYGHSPYNSDSDTGVGHGTPSSSGASTPNSRFFLRMHESWILTPPPCFTAGGPSSQVPMSEMENLLIEHPSMSVYNSHCSRGSSGEDSNLSESSNDNFSNVVAKRGLRPRNSKGQVVRQAPRRPNAVAARCGILAQAEAYRSAQRVKQYKETRNLSNGSLDRHNKNMIRNGKKYSQKNRIQTPSARTFNNKQMKH
ncbi:tumor protein p53-inducible nuclear protein 2-like [Saccostrea cucullata]|uniref:tumor protein p53-inducible nuclear protein 2-like n=1 Tax=Saccostrea cuccullata TaxID=36930 RepID=UPI002ED2649D